MNYLCRDDVSFDETLWEQIDTVVDEAARQILVARRFVPLYGPLGPGVDIAKIDRFGREAEAEEAGFAVMKARALAQIPQLYEDFWLYWRDMAAWERDGLPMDLAAARAAAEALARREDSMVFYGVKSLGIEGLLTAPGIVSQKRGDWSSGENAFIDVSAGMTTLLQNGRIGRHCLIVSSDLFVQLQRIQPGTGVLESERVGKLVGGRLFMSTVLKPGTALMVCAQPQYIDLLVGQDIRTGFSEAVEMNYHLRVMETALPRVKAPDAVVVFKA